MLNRNDLILILTEMEDHGIDTHEQLTRVFTSQEFPIDVVKFINNQRVLDVVRFYEHIRKSYNQKKSKLYINIMKEVTDVTEVLTTLAALNLQILIFSKTAEDKQLFLKHARANEIVKVLSLYYQTYDLTKCQQLLKLIKADISAFEYIQGRRNPSK